MGDLCYINNNNLDNDTEFESYLYLDTGSITENFIDNIQVFDNKADLPSRAKRLVSPYDIIISTVRPNQKHYGILENPEKSLLVSTGFTVLSPNKEMVNAHYLYYYLTQEKTTNYLQMVAESSVSQYPSITSAVIANLEIDLPPIKEQERIVNPIINLDKKMNTNIKLITLLEEYSQLLFHKWFVDFNFPDEEGKPYKDNGGEMYEVDENKIPIGWRIENISDICSIIDCLHSKKPDRVNEINENILLQLENIKAYGLIDMTDKYYVSDEDYKLWTSRIEVKGGDLVITNAGRVAAIAQIPEGANYGIGRNITAIRPVEITPTYLYLYFNSTELKRQIRKNTDQGSFFSSLNVRGIKQLKVIMPGEILMNRFEKDARIIRKRIELLNDENNLLKETRDLLIRKLIK